MGPPARQPAPDPWPIGDDQMAARIRAHDWAATPLGPAAAWPPGLTAAVAIALASPLPTFLAWGRDHTTLYNAPARALLGDRDPAALGRSLGHAWGDGWAALGPPVARALARGEPTLIEDVALPVARGAGAGEGRFTVALSPLRAAAGAVAGLLATLHETTALARAEAALRASEDRAQAIVRNLPGGAVFVLDRDLRYRLAEGEALHRAGLRPGDLVGKTLVEALGPERAARHDATYGRALTGEPFTVEHESNGRDFLTRGVPLRDGAGAVDAVLAVSFDITDRKRAETALRERDELLALALRAAQIGMSSLDLATGVGATTPEWREVLGFPPDHAPQDFETFLALVHPDDRERVAALHADAARAGTGLDFEFRINHPTRGERWILSRSQHHPAADGGPGRLVGLALDITERRRTEAALRESEARFHTLTDLVPVLLWQTDASGDAVTLNQRWLDFTGQTLAETQRGGWLAAIHSDDLPDTRRAFAVAWATRQPLAIEHRVRRRDGVYRWFLVRQVPLRDAAGNAVAWFGAAADIHEARAARDELEARVAERTAQLRALSRQLLDVREEEQRHLARELHDQVGQLLTGLRLALAGARLGGGARGLADWIAQVESIAEELHGRVRALVLDLRPAALDDLGLLPALREQARRFGAQTGVAVDLRHEGLDRRFPPAVETAAYRLVQEALTNVARHAGADAALVQLVADDAWLTVQVRDAGRGFDPAAALAARASAGLAGMRERAALLGGTVAIEAAPGAGTVVTADFPLGGPAADGPGLEEGSP